MAWSDFFNNLRDAVARAQAGATKSANDFLTTPTAVVQPLQKMASGQQNSSKKPYQQVWGFEQDKANYGNERNGDNLIWRDLSVVNNDTGDRFSMSVGYDNDGKISGVRKSENGKVTGYYGQDLVGDFFKNSFDRDATDYSIYDADDGSGEDWLLFSSKYDGAFVPSDALNSRRRSVNVAAPIQRPDAPTVTQDDITREIRIEQGTRDNTMDVIYDKNKIDAAANGTFFSDEFFNDALSMKDAEFFSRNAKDFTDMLSMYSNTPDKDTRMRLLKRAYDTYGVNKWFRGFLEYLASGEETTGGFDGEEYDYRSAFELVGPDVARAYDMLNPRA